MPTDENVTVRTIPKRRRGGQIGNTNAARHFKHTVNQDLKVLDERALDPESDEAKFIAETRNAIVSDLGGEQNITAAKQLILREALHTALHLWRINVWIALRQPGLVNWRTKTAHAVVMQRAKLAETEANLLARIGLERRAHQVNELCSRCGQSVPISTYAHHACQPPAPSEPGP